VSADAGAGVDRGSGPAAVPGVDLGVDDRSDVMGVDGTGRIVRRRFATHPVSISESLAGVVRSLRNEERTGVAGAGMAAMGGVFGRWEEAVGAAVAAHVQPVKLDGTTLIVEVDDPAWATQLRFLEGTLRQRLAEVAGATVDKVEVRVRRR
jgi:predicted nucleic acid-binding Zn ribbon protein